LLIRPERKFWRSRRPKRPQTSWQTVKSNIEKGHKNRESYLVGPYIYRLVHSTVPPLYQSHLRSYQIILYRIIVMISKCL
jgi:hypothetical protein